MDFKVLIPKPVIKFLSIIDSPDKSKILTKLQLLEKEPKHIGSIKLKGYVNQSRFMVGD